MINYQPKSLEIKLSDTAPVERHEMLLKAISAAMRWYALCPVKNRGDQDHVMVLSQFMEDTISLKQD